LNLQPRHGGCWACEGKVDRLRATYHRHSGVRHMFGLYVLETNRLWGVFAAHKTWRDFLAFLKWVRRRYPPHETLHIVLDNYKPHLRTEVLDWAAGARSTLGATCRMKPYASTLTLMKETTRSGGLFLSYWPNGHFFQNAGLLN